MKILRWKVKNNILKSGDYKLIIILLQKFQKKDIEV